MKCKQMETRLIAYLDGKADRAERREAEAHLAACAPCRVRADEIRAVWGVMDELPLLEPSPAFDAHLRARIAAEPRRSLWAWLAPSPRLAFAAMLLLIASVWLSTLPPAPQPNSAPAPMNPEAEFRMIKDLPVLENYDVLANFEALSELPAPPAQGKNEM